MNSALSVNNDRRYRIVFAIGASMADFADMSISPITKSSIGLGNEITIIVFSVAIVGGTGSIKGTFYMHS